MVEEGEAIGDGFMVALLEASRHHADVLEAFLLELLDEELEDPFMVVLDI